MKIIWILLTIGLTFAAKLNWNNSPRPSLSSEKPRTNNISFKLPESKTNNKGYFKTPELNVNINSLGPYPADDISDETSNNKPKIINNGSSLTSSTKIMSSGFNPSLLFLKQKEDPTSNIPEVNYSSDPPSNYFDNLQQIYSVEKYPRISLYEKNRVYLPSYGKDSDNHVFYITLPSPVINETGVKMKTDEYEYTQPDIDKSKDTFPLNLNVQQPNDHSSTLSPGNLNNVNSKTLLHTTVSPTQKEPTIFNHIENYRPHRTQAQAEQQAVILNYEQSINSEGYAYSYETSNGIHGEEKGTATNGVRAEGSYSYLGDDGILYKVEYTADQNGFVPKGDHLPTAPPIPDAILKVIEQATRDKESGIYDDGLYDEKKYGYQKYQGGYPKANDIVNRANFPKEIEKHMANCDLFDEYHDLCEQNGIEKLENSQEIELSDYTNNNENHDNDNDAKINNTSSSKMIVLNKNYQYLSSQSELDVSTSNKNSETPAYGNLAPQNPVFNVNKFKPRFSELDHTEIKEKDTEEMTPKPFLTPYVTRRGENSEIADYDDIAHLNTDSNELPFGNRFKENNGDDTNNKPINNIDKEGDSREFISDDVPEQQEQDGDRIYSHLPSDEEAHFYSPGESYTTFTPTDFSSVISTQDVNHSFGRGPSSLQISSITNTTLLIDNSSAREPTSTLPKHAISPVLDSESTSVYPDAYSKADSITTSQTIQTTVLVPKFDMRPTSESSSYTKYNIRTSTENTIDIFSGPQQPQGSDHITGYDY